MAGLAEGGARFHWEIEQGVAEALRDRGWSVEAEPRLAAWRPDLLIRDNVGHTYIVELKVARGSTHFGSLGQLASLTENLRSSKLIDDLTGTLLMTTQEVPPSIATAARDLGIQIVQVKEGDSPHEMADDLVRKLRGISSS